MTPGLRERLKVEMERQGLSANAVSLKAGMSSDAIRGIFRNPDSSPTLETISKIAKSLSVSEQWLAFGIGSADDVQELSVVGELNIIGEVAAGLWMDTSEFSFQPIPYPVPPDPRFPSDAQYLLRVRGNSINRKAPEGSLIRCLNIHGAPRPPQNDDWVVVQRYRVDGNVETTVKRLVIDRQHQKTLWPDSTDPAFQSPIPLAEDDGDEVRIVAFVIDFINPATRL